MIPEGTHTPESLGIDYNAHNCTIFGESAGNTFIEGDIKTTGWRPEIQNVTIRGTLTLENCSECYMNNVWIHPPIEKMGLTISIMGRGERVRWPLRGEEIKTPRAAYMNFHNVHILGQGNGWYFLNGGGDGFINHIYIYGGHTAVNGVGMSLVGIKQLKSYGHHIDAEPEKGLIIDSKCKDIYWDCAYVEQSWNAKQQRKPVVIGNIEQFHPIDWPLAELVKCVDEQSYLYRSDVEGMH